MTLHRAFDLTPEPHAALEHAIELGFERILSSGQASRAPEGAPLLAALVARARGRIEIMAGCGITAASVASLLDGVRPHALHASCKTRVAGAFADIARTLPEDTDFSRTRTDPAGVRALRAAIDRHALVESRA